MGSEFKREVVQRTVAGARSHGSAGRCANSVAALETGAIIRHVARTLLLLLLAMIAAAPPAYAQKKTSAADKETARGLMVDGRARRGRNDLQGALKSFLAAHAIMHVPTTGVEVARTQVSMGQLVEARDTLLDIARIPETPNEPAPFRKAREEAARLNDGLTPRIPSVTIIIKGPVSPSDVTATIDDMSVASDSLGLPRKINPGTHVVVVTVGGRDTREEFTVADGQTIEVPITVEAPVGPAVSTTKRPPARPSSPAKEPSHGPNALFWTGAGMAGAGLIVGTVSGIMSLSRTRDARSGCVDNLCPPETHGDIDAAHKFATISTVSFVVAGVGAGVAGISLLVHPAKSTKPHSEATLNLWVSPTSVAVRGGF